MQRGRFTYVSGPYDGERLLFNAATGAFAVLDEAAYERYRALIDEEDAHGIDADEPLAQALLDAGFLTLDAEAEAIAQRRVFQAAQRDRSTMSLCIAPTYGCNLRCPYCYEQDQATAAIMDDKVADGIFDLVAAVYEREPFEHLDVQWYGGEPTLALDVVKSLSARLIAWCEERGVAYSAAMISNATNIGPRAAELLAQARVGTVMTTVDGPEALCDRRRRRADGGSSWEAIRAAIPALRQAGVDVVIFCNMDKINATDFEAFQQSFYEECGVMPIPTKLNDYHGTFGCAPFAAPDFDLFSFPEFARWDFEQFAQGLPGREEIEARLTAAPVFCKGQLENYYCVDASGDVYKCDGRMNHREYAVGNVTAPYRVDALATSAPNPSDDAMCGQCSLLPICRGNCSWERQCCGMPCHPLKYTLDDYLALYRRQFPAPASGFTLLVPPHAA